MFPSPLKTMNKSLHLLRSLGLATALALTARPAFPQAADAPAAPGDAAPPPKSWIDPDTGHRVIRLTDEPGSDSFYFNFNAYTPDMKWIVFRSNIFGPDYAFAVEVAKAASP